MRSECPRIGYPRIVPASWDAVSWDTVSWDTPGYLRIAVSYLGILDSIPGYGVPGYGIPRIGCPRIVVASQDTLS